MKKTFHTYNYVFLLMLFLLIYFLSFTVYEIYKCFWDIHEIKYLVFGIFDVYIFTIFVLHFGKIKITVTHTTISWVKELFVPTHEIIKRPSDRLKYFGFTYQNCTRTIISEKFDISTIEKYGLLEDFSDNEIVIDEKVPVIFISKQILVFKLKSGKIFYSSVKGFSKNQLKRFLYIVYQQSEIMPENICKKVLHLKF